MHSCEAKPPPSPPSPALPPTQRRIMQTSLTFFDLKNRPQKSVRKCSTKAPNGPQNRPRIDQKMTFDIKAGPSETMHIYSVPATSALPTSPPRGFKMTSENFFRNFDVENRAKRDQIGFKNVSKNRQNLHFTFRLQPIFSPHCISSARRQWIQKL